jgi:probable HAF family extracellular repeat protein
MKRLAVWVSLASVMLWLGGTARAEFIHLGWVDPGHTISTANGVSANGQIVVGESWSTTSHQGYRWTMGSGVVPLPPLLGTYSSGRGISADGSVIVGQVATTGGYTAARWIGASVETLGSLTPSGVGSAALAASGNGQVVVGTSDSSTAPWGMQGFVWSAQTGIQGLPFFSDGSGMMSEALNISDDGLQAVGYIETEDTDQAVVWDVQQRAEPVHGLGWLPDGGGFSVATRISGNSQVVVGQSDFANGWAAVRWTGSGIENLGSLVSGTYVANAATAISADGAIIAGYNSAPGYNSFAFIWDTQHGMRDLKDVLQTEYGFDLTGWRLANVYDMSADGMVLVGDGINPQGLNEAWIAIIPEPGTASLFVLGLGLLLRRR